MTNHRESEDDYTNTVARISDRWRVIVCRDGIQWILQRRDAGRLAGARWRSLGYCLTRKGLMRLCAAHSARVDPAALSALAALPEHITGGVVS